MKFHKKELAISKRYIYKWVTKRWQKIKDDIFYADFGAASLDILREKFPKNFIHCGISEQAMLDIASGLAIEKNKVFVYAMNLFLLWEQLNK